MKYLFNSFKEFSRRTLVSNENSNWFSWKRILSDAHKFHIRSCEYKKKEFCGNLKCSIPVLWISLAQAFCFVSFYYESIECCNIHCTYVFSYKSKVITSTICTTFTIRFFRSYRFAFFNLRPSRVRTSHYQPIVGIIPPYISNAYLSCWMVPMHPVCL